MNVAVEPWFAREPAGDGVWHLWEQHVDPFLRCNVWLVIGRDRALVIDTGLGLVSLHDAAGELFDRPVTAVATHYHFDHTGALHEFDERLAHRRAVPYLKTPIAGALRRAGFDDATWQSFLDAGYELDDELLRAVPSEEFDVDAYSVAACPPTRVLDEGDVVDLGDVAFEVLHLPVTRLIRSDSGTKRAACFFRATRCTTGRCSTTPPTPTSTTTSRPWCGCGVCRSASSTPATKRASAGSASSSCATHTSNGRSKADIRAPVHGEQPV
jgi:hypothetical protein